MKRIALLLTLAACSSNAPPPPQTASPPPVATAPTDAGAEAAATASAPPRETPPQEQLTCPTPSVAAALRSCEDIDKSIPTMQAISDIQQKIAVAEMNAKPKKPPKTEAERLAPKPLTKAHKEFFKMTRTFLCKNETSREHNEIAYLEARYFFELQHWEEAAVIFDEMALGPYTDTSPYAAQMALEAFNILATKLGRSDCTRTLEVRIHQYIRQLCESPATKGADANTCSTFRKVRDDLKASPRRGAP